ncbi:hypothetical protein PoMZ_12435 [Pyricularia oryzae]|uniref:Uncharacterized protein n=1 Tax=Pyricularia oryzae TaxID=318829 RepID=A0A4P7NSM7_PYROR|nr:hypothetical protein PoMZ_12435 [Pyricularia oryzae]
MEASLAKLNAQRLCHKVSTPQSKGYPTIVQRWLQMSQILWGLLKAKEYQIACRTSATRTPSDYITKDAFPLPNLHSSKLSCLSRELHIGHGFFVIRRLDADRYTREENNIVYAGVSSHIGSIRGRQYTYTDGQRADVVIGHIQDVRLGFGTITTTTNQGRHAYIHARYYTYAERQNLVRARPIHEHACCSATRPPSPDGKTPDRALLQYDRPCYVGFGDSPRQSPSRRSRPSATRRLKPLTRCTSWASDSTCRPVWTKGDMRCVNNVALFYARDGDTDSQEKQ